ncbi:MAG: glycine--tRNA ligase [Nitrososphaerota archaeon]|jgi:glycyl-tRNA synthetase|nr:glycine--tRNA ligase [Nitrososphaerota archaeon]MDG6932686.1 glycine--tRNA ligase [Nitrososphaerota archaeon]MDG6935471.1 glycine--tRNA ligase [Nitrososphaerota archaeon]MDG6944138.1 glycine--tRNA ligase [Nitrososphaerota archaeon]
MDKLTEVLNLAKSKGYFWPSYEIYGGVSGFYTLGPMGSLVLRNIEDLWRSYFIRPNGFLEIDSPDIMPARVLKASGHVDNFKDPMAECKKCGSKYRADHLLKDSGIQISESASINYMSDLLNQNQVKCPNCGATAWNVKQFLNMFETNIGPYAENRGYLRPETAQGIFVEFKTLIDINRGRLPMGVAQIGKGYRNEISPRQSMVRLREFHMMELELFMDPEDEEAPALDSNIKLPLLHEKVIQRGEPEMISPSEAYRSGVIKSAWLAYFLEQSFRFIMALGVPESKQRFIEKLAGERAHYSAQTFDHEVFFDEMGWTEVAGLAYRTDYDLKSHSKETGQELVAIEKKAISTRKAIRLNEKEVKHNHLDGWEKILSSVPESRADGIYAAGIRLSADEYKIIEEVEKEEVRKFVPHVVEPSFGLDRLLLTAVYYAYGKKEGRNILSLPHALLEKVVAVLPLVSKEDMLQKAIEIKAMLEKSGYFVIFDEKGYIGKRYARLDEAGIPKAITIDGQTLEDGTVTVRDRDTWSQERVNPSDLLV